MKKICLFFLCVALLISVVPAALAADTGVTTASGIGGGQLVYIDMTGRTGDVVLAGGSVALCHVPYAWMAELGLTEDEYAAMAPDELAQRKEKAAQRYLEAGADLVIDSIRELPEAVAELNRRMAEKGAAC